MGLVSPQFHIKFDDLFKMVPSSKVSLQWPKCMGFVKSQEGPLTEPLTPDSYYLPLTAAKSADHETVATQPES
jgi:hypothetical protein